MRIVIIFISALLLSSCSEKEIQIVKINFSSEYVYNDGTTLIANENEVVISIDIKAKKKYSYDFPPSYLLTNEPINIDDIMTDEETWFNLDPEYDSRSEVIMKSNWVEVDEPDWLKPDAKYDFSEYVRLIFVIDRNIKEGFLNVRDHKSVKISFDHK